MKTPGRRKLYSPHKMRNTKKKVSENLFTRDSIKISKATSSVSMIESDSILYDSDENQAQVFSSDEEDDVEENIDEIDENLVEFDQTLNNDSESVASNQKHKIGESFQNTLEPQNFESILGFNNHVESVWKEYMENYSLNNSLGYWSYIVTMLKIPMYLLLICLVYFIESYNVPVRGAEWLLYLVSCIYRGTPLSYQTLLSLISTWFQIKTTLIAVTTNEGKLVFHKTNSRIQNAEHFSYCDISDQISIRYKYPSYLKLIMSGQKSLPWYIRKQTFCQALTNIPLQLFIDGVNVAKNRSIVPVFLVNMLLPISERFKKQNVMLVSIMDKKELGSYNAYLQYLVTELNRIHEDGFLVKFNQTFLKFRARVFNIVADAKEKNEILMLPVNGYNSCSECMQKGEYHENRIVFTSISYDNRCLAWYKSVMNR